MSDHTRKCEQALGELLSALSEIRLSHPEIFNLYLNRLSNLHQRLLTSAGK